ncbi:MAG: hypothetical protein NC251_06270 [Lachnoclostridium sp.]|nr:hypothetical protein [Lachnospira sp.]MCM1248020.1 hypothetical protein [Lachnoclostridium sp.]
MNEEGKKKEFNYEEEKAKLKKKLIIFLATTVGFTVLFVLAMEDSNFFQCLMAGLACGLVFYIPGRLRDYFHMGWPMTIVIAVAYLLILLFLADKIGAVAYILLLFPIGDMGYSIYRVISYKKKGGGE